LSMTRLANTSATSATPPGSLVIDFETVPMPIVKSTSDGLTIFNQYESLGVKFPEKATIRESPAIARSGARVLSVVGQEFPQSKMIMQFTAPQRRIKVWC